jgi:agmatine deiminase
MNAVAANRMPAETDRHERTLMAWPTQLRSGDLWRGQLERARDDYATIANAIACFEPVTLVVHPPELATVGHRVDDRVDLVAMEIDDSWLRDSGPIVVRDERDAGARRAVHFGFNAWGNKFSPLVHDVTIGARLASHLGLPVVGAPMVLEGGSIAVDGTGTLVTTESCLLNPNRNPSLSRVDIEVNLRDYLGAQRVVWLEQGIAEDEGTDGHVDNVVAFFAPGRALLQGCDDPGNPNGAIARANRKALEAAGIDVVEVPHLAYTDEDEPFSPVPYVNLYACNGAVFVPVTGDPRDDEVLALIGSCYPGREVVPVPGTTLSYGGGGVHCITQQVPAE